MRQLFVHISFTVNGPATVALMGPSGVGKSTLLAILAGQETPSKGSADFTGESNKPPHVEWLVQSAPILAHRSAADNADLGRRMRFGDEPHALMNVRSALEAVGLSGLSEVPAYRLSGGERQRVAFVRSLLARPDILLLDEPTASLDSRSRDQVIATLSEFQSPTAIAIIATHDPAVAGKCDSIVSLAAT